MQPIPEENDYGAMISLKDSDLLRGGGTDENWELQRTIDPVWIPHGQHRQSISTDRAFLRLYKDSLKRLVIVKVARPNSDKFWLRQEIQIYLSVLNQCRHPFILPMLWYTDPDQPQITPILGTSFMENGSVKDLLYFDGHITQQRLQPRFISQGSLTPHFRRQIIYQILSVVSYTHKTLKLIHRDIKPENFVVDTKGDIRLVDWENVINFGKDHQVNRESWKGTPGYSVPYSTKHRVIPCTPTLKLDTYPCGILIIQLFGQLSTDQRQAISDATCQEQFKTKTKLVKEFLHGKQNCFKPVRRVAPWRKSVEDVAPWRKSVEDIAQKLLGVSVCSPKFVPEYGADCALHDWKEINWPVSEGI